MSQEYESLFRNPRLDEIMELIKSCYLILPRQEVSDEIYRKFDIKVKPKTVDNMIARHDFIPKTQENKYTHSIKHIKGLREVYNKELFKGNIEVIED